MVSRPCVGGRVRTTSPSPGPTVVVHRPLIQHQELFSGYPASVLDTGRSPGRRKGDALLDWSIPHVSPFGFGCVPESPLQIGRPSVEVVIVPDAKAGGEL